VREDLAPPQPNHPLTAIRRQGVVVGVTNMPATLTVQLGGDTTVNIEMPYLTPAAVNDIVYVLGNQGDYVVLGPVSKCRPYAHLTGTGGTLASSTTSTNITNWSAPAAGNALCGTAAATGFTPNADGHYLVVGIVVWAANATGRRGMFPLVAGGVQTNGSAPGAGSNSGLFRHDAAFVVDVTAGQEISLTVFQDSGGNLSHNPDEMAVIWQRELN
jgi:hypothetical protein